MSIFNRIFDRIESFLVQMVRELGEVAREIDGTGWAILSVLLLICGWFFLKGNKIRAT